MPDQLLCDGALVQHLAVQARALPPGCPVPEHLQALVELTAEHCALIGDGYGRGLGDATAGAHIRAVFGL
ncbi:MAG: hypothetical protein V4505_25515 [Pseudomonadota bacterium]